jgi:hypothetical protein
LETAVAVAVRQQLQMVLVVAAEITAVAMALHSLEVPERMVETQPVLTGAVKQGGLPAVVMVDLRMSTQLDQVVVAAVQVTTAVAVAVPQRVLTATRAAAAVVARGMRILALE